MLFFPVAALLVGALVVEVLWPIGHGGIVGDFAHVLGAPVTAYFFGFARFGVRHERLLIQPLIRWCGSLIDFHIKLYLRTNVYRS